MQVERAQPEAQPGTLFPLRVPVAVTVEGEPTAQLFEVDLGGARAEGRPVTLSGRPLRVAVDPAFDVFRRLDPREVPPALGALFGAAKVTLVLPSGRAAPRRSSPPPTASSPRAWGATGAGEVAVVTRRRRSTPCRQTGRSG